MRILLLPISFFYHIALAIRHQLYDWKLLRSHRFEMPLICIGNLNLGGTGKTPHTEHLVELLRDTYRVATLSRGYGRASKGFRMADGACSYQDIGDEPVQYHTKYPEITVAVDEDRVEGVQRLMALPTPPEVILLDDAFQHRHIEAGLNILLTEYGHLYTDDHLVPAGSLRDLKKASQRADIIVVSKSPKDLDDEAKASIIRQLQPMEHQTVFFSYLEYATPRPLNEAGERHSFSSDDSVLLFSGIANPQPLVEELQGRFANVDTLRFPDHHSYSETDVQAILRRLDRMEGKNKIIITTEKDEARLRNSPYLCQFETVPLFAAPVSIRFEEEEKYHEEILSYVRKNAHHR